MGRGCDYFATPGRGWDEIIRWQGGLRVRVSPLAAVCSDSGPKSHWFYPERLQQILVIGNIAFIVQQIVEVFTQFFHFPQPFD